MFFVHGMRFCSDLMLYGLLISFWFVGLWIGELTFVGYKNKLLIEKSEIVE